MLFHDSRPTRTDAGGGHHRRLIILVPPHDWGTVLLVVMSGNSIDVSLAKIPPRVKKTACGPDRRQETAGLRRR